GKNAILAALSVADMKHVVVVDDDIDVFDPTEVDWAIATRVQADRDFVIISGARSKPLDPSLPPTASGVPTTAQSGIDGPIPENVPREREERITDAYAHQVKLDDVLGAVDGPLEAPPRSPDVPALAERIRALIERQRLYFAEIAERFDAEGFSAV